jgi:hypothetical protein
VAQDVDALAVVGDAPNRLDARRAEPVELGGGRPGDDDPLLAIPDGNESRMEARLQVARENSDPPIAPIVVDARPHGSGRAGGQKPNEADEGQYTDTQA